MNTIKLSGCVEDAPSYSHTVSGEKFYYFYINNIRKSGNSDILKCVVSEKYVNQIDAESGIEIIGEVRTRISTRDDGTPFCEVYVFVKEVMEYLANEEYDTNVVKLNGFICKIPTYRKTPKGREISDLIVASNRDDNSKRSDYIPTIAWHRNALRVSYMEMGTQVNAVGRLQSREYQKKIADDLYETRIAYELSVKELEVVNNAE